MYLVSAKDMLVKAKAGHYAVGQFNINNLEWTKAILMTAEELKSPVILGVSEGAGKYMGGYNAVVGMVNGLLKDLKISVPVALHLDHGSFEGCYKCLDAGFSSIMFDGSHYPIDENVAKTTELVAAAHKMGVLAAGIGNIHGVYPPNWKGLSFETLDAIQKKTGILPLVLHGGTGIPADMIKKAIELGVSKINVNTECQISFTAATREYFEANKDKASKGFDPRKVLAPGFEAIKATVKEKMELFGSVGKAE